MGARAPTGAAAHDIQKDNRTTRRATTLAPHSPHAHCGSGAAHVAEHTDTIHRAPLLMGSGGGAGAIATLLAGPVG